jgi:soluble P-type ATPase
MTKPGIEIKIPNFGELHIKTICSDYTGTFSVGGELIGGVRKRLRKLAESVDIHVVTADTNNTSENELKDLPLTRHRIESDVKPHHIYKRDYILEQGLDPKHVAVFGNGRNDRCWLKLVTEADGLAVAVDVGEGCAIETIKNANVFISGIDNGLDLLLCPNRIKATLRS